MPAKVFSVFCMRPWGKWGELADKLNLWQVKMGLSTKDNAGEDVLLWDPNCRAWSVALLKVKLTENASKLLAVRGKRPPLSPASGETYTLVKAFFDEYDQVYGEGVQIADYELDEQKLYKVLREILLYEVHDEGAAPRDPFSSSSRGSFVDKCILR